MSLLLSEEDLLSCVSAALPWGVGLLAAVTLLAGLALLAGAVAGRRRPAVRHLIASLGLAGLLGLLATAGRLPEWGTAAAVVAAGWAVGASLLTGRLLLDTVALMLRPGRRPLLEDRALTARARTLAREAGIGRRVRVMRGDADEIPHAWGLLAPRVILPSSAPGWPAARRDAVLLHELAHVGRHDVALSLLAGLAGAVLWFHPLVHRLRRQAARDAEQACDALVLAQGMPAAEYARHLLAVAREARPRRAVVAPALAAEADLSSRIQDLLSSAGRQPGATPGRLAAMTLTLAAAALLAPGLLLAVHRQPSTVPASAGLAACFDESSFTSIPAPIASEEASVARNR